jgi:hypothetical protein
VQEIAGALAHKNFQKNGSGSQKFLDLCVLLPASPDFCPRPHDLGKTEGLLGTPHARALTRASGSNPTFQRPLIVLATVLKMRIIRTITPAKQRNMPMNTPSRTTAPTIAKRTVSRGRLPNGAYRTREYLIRIVTATCLLIDSLSRCPSVM